MRLLPFFQQFYYILRKLKGHNEAIALLSKLKRLVRISTVSEAEIQQALSSSFQDFEDAIQHYAARNEGDVTALITRNAVDFQHSEIPVMSPEKFLAQVEAAQ